MDVLYAECLILSLNILWLLPLTFLCLGAATQMWNCLEAILLLFWSKMFDGFLLWKVKGGMVLSGEMEAPHRCGSSARHLSGTR